MEHTGKHPKRPRPSKTRLYIFWPSTKQHQNKEGERNTPHARRIDCLAFAVSRALPPLARAFLLRGSAAGFSIFWRINCFSLGDSHSAALSPSPSQLLLFPEDPRNRGRIGLGLVGDILIETGQRRKSDSSRQVCARVNFVGVELGEETGAEKSVTMETALQM